jgi:ABC transporter DrrB family efflux protein
MKRMLATTIRVLQQLRHDPRTVALMLLVPVLLLSLLKWMFNDNPMVFNRVGPGLLGLFPLVVMFLITSITVLRERNAGTLERLLITPMRKHEFVFGYAIAFGIAAAIQAVIASALTLGPLGLQLAGSQGLLVVVAILNALVGMSLGLFFSAFAKTEFQAIQFLPAVIFPQFLLCGLLVPRDQLPSILSAISDFLPLSHAVDAMGELASRGNAIGSDVLVIVVFLVGALVAGAATLRRRTA